jgi:hypothetical protein
LILGALCLDSLETKAGKLVPAGRT